MEQAVASSLNDMVLCFGDSITRGIGDNNWRGENASMTYPGILQRKINIPVINAGVPGDTTSDASARLYRDVLAKNPRVVIINLGVNDFLSRIDIRQTEHNFNFILSYLNDGDRKIYVTKFYTDEILWQKLAEWNIPEYQREELIAAYNRMYYSLAQKYNVEIIPDVWTGVWHAHMSDDVHPNAEGYRIMADHYFAALQPWLEANQLLR
jgi:lysophospholipase L1-like esterase